MTAPIPLLVLAGPTGTGKTAVGIELCERLDGEIVSADSMLIYRGCDVCTAKPSLAERARVRHHLIDIRDPDQGYSAAEWARDAAAAIEDIFNRGKQPIVVGGTGFYIRALLEPDLLATVPPDQALRARLEEEAERSGPEILHDRLQAIDPPAARRLHPNDLRRVIRALEVAHGKAREGQPSELTTGREMRYYSAVFALDVPRDKLYCQLDERVDRMLRSNALEEVRHLLAAGVPRGGTVLQGVGYRQILPALENPEVLPDAVESWKRETRRYAKRQMTWFRHQLDVQWIPAVGGVEVVAEEIASLWRQRLRQFSLNED